MEHGCPYNVGDYIHYTTHYAPWDCGSQEMIGKIEEIYYLTADHAGPWSLSIKVLASCIGNDFDAIHATGGLCKRVIHGVSTNLDFKIGKWLKERAIIGKDLVETLDAFEA